MSTPSATIPLSLPIASPSLRDVLSAWKTDVMLSTNCHGIATIQSTRLGSNGLLLVSATMNYSRTYYEKTTSGVYQAKQLQYPQMIDCPAVVLGGGPASASFPIAQGDQCLILFNDRDLTNWFAGAMSGPVQTSRLHSFADAVALVGFQKPSGLNTDHAILTDGTASVGFNTDTDKLTFQNGDTSLHSVLLDIMGVLSSLNSALTGIISPTDQAAIAAEISSTNSIVDSLLE